MTEMPMTDAAARMLTGRRLGGALTLAGMVGGTLVALVGWLGWHASSPGERLDSVEHRLDMQETAASASKALLEGIAVKMCLDADSSVEQRDNLARSGIPCDALFTAKGLRPGRM
jgi:hypothetical protein